MDDTNISNILLDDTTVHYVCEDLMDCITANDLPKFRETLRIIPDILEKLCDHGRDAALPYTIAELNGINHDRTEFLKAILDLFPAFCIRMMESLFMSEWRISGRPHNGEFVMTSLVINSMLPLLTDCQKAELHKEFEYDTNDPHINAYAKYVQSLL